MRLISKFAASISGTTIASSYHSVGAWSNSAIVRLSAIVIFGGSTRIRRNLLVVVVVAAASDAHVDVFPGADVSHSLPHPTSDVPTTEVPTDVLRCTTVPTSSSVPAAETIPANSGTTPKTHSSPVRDARKGKGVAVEEPTSTHDKTFKQLEEERLGWEAAQRLQAQELANFEKQRAESLMNGCYLVGVSHDFADNEESKKETAGEAYDTIPAQCLFKTRTGDDEANVEAPSHGVPQEEENKVPSQKATIEDVDASSNLASTAQHTASSLKKVGTKKKRLGRKGVHTSQSTIQISEGDLEAAYKLLPTGLGSINAFYRLDNSCKYFTSLREILHLVTRADLMTIYGRVMTFYQDKKAAGVGLVLWGDLKVLMDSPEVNDGSDVWKNQHTWRIQSWKLYSFSGVHVLETVGGLVLHMFMDKKYPLSVNLIERMLDHQLEICHGSVGNELTTAVQLIAFLKKQISDSKRPKVHDCPRVNGYLVKASSNPLLFFDSPLPGVNTPWDVMRIVCNPDLMDIMLLQWFFDAASLMLLVRGILKIQHCWDVVPTGRVKVPAGRYVVPTGKDNVIVSAGRTKVIPAGRTILVLISVTDWYQSQGYREPVMSPDSAVTYTSVYSEARSWSIPSKDPYEETARQLLEPRTHVSQITVVMSADSAVTYTSVHSEARSWSIPSEDPYEEAARQLLEQAPRSPEYVPDPIELEDHIPVYIPEPEHPEDLVPAEDEAPTPPLPPFFLSPRIRPPRTRAAMAQMRATTPSTYHSLLPSGTPPLLPIPLPAPSTSRRADIPEADTPPRKRLLLTTPRPSCEVGESSAAAAARPS
ncbi:hypothetical protein Tco_1142680 [Tanacetum coccineum]